jgi:hypothetical protein
VLLLMTPFKVSVVTTQRLGQIVYPSDAATLPPNSHGSRCRGSGLHPSLTPGLELPLPRDRPPSPTGANVGLALRRQSPLPVILAQGRLLPNVEMTPRHGKGAQTSNARLHGSQPSLAGNGYSLPRRAERLTRQFFRFYIVRFVRM